MNTESTEHGKHNVGRKLILAHEGSSEKELEITWWAVDSSGHAYGHYSAKDNKGLVHTVGLSDFSEGQASWVTPMNESTEHGIHNVGRKLIWSCVGSPDVELEITSECGGGLGPRWYLAKTPDGDFCIVRRSYFIEGRARWVRNHDRHCNGKPCECGANPPPRLPVWQAFYRARVQAKTSPQYDEEVWNKLQSEILALIYPQSEAKDCAECIALREEGVGPYHCAKHTD